MKYKKIKSIEQYNRYCEIHEKLTLKDYEANKDQLELIEILIDEYENRTIEYPKEMSPVQALAHLLEENEITKSQLARDLKVSRQLITDILNYRRSISKSMIMKLSNRFKMRPIAFSRDYKLKGSRRKRVSQTA